MVMTKEERKRKRSPTLKKMSATLKEVQGEIKKKLKQDGIEPDKDMDEKADLIDGLIKDMPSTPEDGIDSGSSSVQIRFRT